MCVPCDRSYVGKILTCTEAFRHYCDFSYPYSWDDCDCAFGTKFCSWIINRRFCYSSSHGNIINPLFLYVGWWNPANLTLPIRRNILWGRTPSAKRSNIMKGWLFPRVLSVFDKNELVQSSFILLFKYEDKAPWTPKSLAIADLPLLLQGILLWSGIDFVSPNSPQVTVSKSARSCASRALMSRGKLKGYLTSQTV